MNERIRELVEQAGFYVTEKNGAALAQFAELIVRECIETMYNTEQITVAQFVDTTLKEHFGVQ